MAFKKKCKKHFYKLVWIDTITDQLLFECNNPKCMQRWRVGRSELYMYLMFPREWPG